MGILLRLLRPQVLLLLVGVALLGYYLLKRMSKEAQARARARGPNMPYCPKCESNRHVAHNSGDDPRFPREKSAWYCQKCGEGF